jgi:hypothetical protein
MLGLKEQAADKIGRERGYANLSMGSIAALSLALPAWLVPAAVAGGLFLALAGIKHATNADRSRKQDLAMVTDLIVACALAGYLGSLVLR